MSEEIQALAALSQQAQARRAELHPGYFPVPSADFAANAEGRIRTLLGRDDAVYIGAQGEDGQVLGFAAASTVTAPPVYAPGGPVGFVREWHVADDKDTVTIGGDLLN